MQLKLADYTPRQIICLFIISSVLLMENIDANILNVAIPQMAHSFQTSVFTLKLAVTSYLIGLSIFIPISGWIANRFGARNTLLFSIVLFTLMSIQCGLSSSVNMLIICRLLQGLAGAFMVPVGRLLLLKIFSKQQMVKAYTIMGMPVMLGPIFAPILGGYLVTYFSWRYIFWVNIPLGILVFIATLKYVENYREAQNRFNLLSFVFLALFLSCVCFWLDIVLLSEVGFLIKIILFIAAVVFGLIYFLIERSSKFPVVCYKLFKLRTFSTCFFSTIIIRAALGGRAFVLAIFLELTYHLSAFQAGVYFIYMSLGVLSSRTIVRKMLDRYGFKRTLTFANLGSCIALLMLGMVTQLNWVLYLALFLNGIFAAAQFMSMNILYYAEVESPDYGSAVSIAATWQQLGVSLGVIVAAGMLHYVNQALSVSFSHASFHWTFIGLALVNLSCQFLINRLQISDGQSLLGSKAQRVD